MRRNGLTFPLIEANAEDVPLPVHCSTLPYPSTERASVTVPLIPEAPGSPPEAACLLTNSPLNIPCARGARFDVRDASASTAWLQLDWSDGGVEFHLAHGDMFGLLRESGFDVEALIELYAPEDAETHPYYTAVTADWARKWPSEEIWAARKTS
jgi:hypothetical protein